MVYVTSHDLQVPLISMEGFASELLESYSDKLDKDGQHYLKRLQKNAQNMQKLVISLLDISRLNTRKLDVEKFYPSDVIDNILKDLEITIEQAKAIITVKELPKTTGDKIRIDGLFRKLITNALNYHGKNINIGYRNNSFFVKDDGRYSCGSARENL